MLRPTDIQSKQFEIKMRGYDRDQVDDFLDELIRDVTVMYRDNAELIAKLERAEKEIATLRAKCEESKKSRDLIMYRCEEMKKNAQIEAEQTVAQAKVDANEVMNTILNSKEKMKALCAEFLEKIDKI